jgi:hypothetical protein
MNASVQLQKNVGREFQGACRQDELIGGKPPVVGRAIAQAVSRWLPTAAAGVQIQV